MRVTLGQREARVCKVQTGRDDGFTRQRPILPQVTFTFTF